MKNIELKVGSRGSELSLVQTRLVSNAFSNAHPSVELNSIPFQTLGDRKQGTPAARNGDKRDWIHELDLAVANGEIDIAVHSAKDVPIDINANTTLVPVLQRADPRDLFIGRKQAGSSERIGFSALPKNALVGTGSPRRSAQLLRLRPDLIIVDHRGNVPTRLRKLEESSELHGIVLAAAGVDRLNIHEASFEALNIENFVPAVNQGIIVCQIRSDRTDLKQMLEVISSKELLGSFTAERKVIETLGADCHSAVGVHALSSAFKVDVVVQVFSPDGTECVEVKGESSLADAASLGISLGAQALDRGAKELLVESRTKRIACTMP